MAGPGLYDMLSAREKIVKGLTAALKVQPEQLEARVASMSEEQRKLSAEVERLKVRLAIDSAASADALLAQTTVAIAKCEALLPSVTTLPSGVRLLVLQVDGVDAAALGTAAQHLEKTLGNPAAVVLGSAAAADKVCLAAAFSPAVVQRGASAGAVMGPLAKLCGGGGGGKPAFAQAGGRDPTRVAEALEQARQQLLVMLDVVGPV